MFIITNFRRGHSLSFAKRKIEAAGPEDGIYLIRQNPEDFASYCLTVRLDGRIKNYKINIDDGTCDQSGQQKKKNLGIVASGRMNLQHLTIKTWAIFRIMSPPLLPLEIPDFSEYPHKLLGWFFFKNKTTCLLQFETGQELSRGNGGNCLDAPGVCLDAHCNVFTDSLIF